MSLCPDRSSTDWIALTQAVGEYRAYQDWMENNYVIRDPETVLAKLEQRNPVMFTRRKPGATRVPNSPLDILKRELGIYKSQVSDNQRIKINQRIGLYNKKYGTSHFMPRVQIGQADLYKTDIDEKWNGYNPNQGTLDFIRGPVAHDRYGDDIDSIPDEIMRLNASDTPLGQDQGNINSLPIIPDPLHGQIAMGAKIAKALGDALVSKVPGVNVEYFDENQATAFFKGRTQKWNGEAGFWDPNTKTAYVVVGRATSQTAWHEIIAHPIVEDLYTRKRDVFDSLYNELASTTAGLEVIKQVDERYPEYDAESRRKEALVTALGVDAQDIRLNRTQGTGFKAFIKKLLYHVKQFLRSLSPQPVDVADLNTASSLRDLARMMESETFRLGDENVSEQELLSFSRATPSMIEEMLRVKEKAGVLTREMTAAAKKDTLTKLPKEQFEEVKGLIENEFGRRDITSILGKLGPFTGTTGAQRLADLGETEFANKQASALIDSMYTFEHMANKISTELKHLRGVTDINKPDMLKVQFVKELVENWEPFVKAARRELKEELPADSELRRLVGSISDTIEDVKSYYRPVMVEGWTNMAYQVWSDYAEQNRKQWEQRNKDLVSAGVSPKVIELERKEFLGSDVTKDKIREMLKGTSTDANYFNHMIEGWMYSSDPIVGSLHRYIREGIYNGYNRAYTNFQKLINDIKPMLDEFTALGMGPKEVNAFANLLLVNEDFGRFSKEGSWDKLELKTITKKVFHSPTIGWDAVSDKYAFEIHKARAKFEETGDQTSLEEAIRLGKEFADLKRKYLNAPYKPEIYERDAVWDKPHGPKARELYTEIFDKIDNNYRAAHTEEDKLDAINENESLLKDLKELKSLTDLNGQEKTGESLEIAKLLREYTQLGIPYREWVEYPGLFQQRFKDFTGELAGKGLQQGTDEYNDAVNKWIDGNTTVAVTEEYYQKLKELNEKIQAIFKQIPNLPPEHKELADLYLKKSQVLYQYKDSDQQPLGSDMNEATQKEVKDLEEKIARLKKKINSGMTPEESNRYTDLKTMLNSGVRLSDEERQEYYSLVDKWVNKAIPRSFKIALSSLYEQLAGLQSKEPTDDYIDIFNNYLSKAPESLKDELVSKNKFAFIDKNTADYVLNVAKGTLDKMMENDPEFRDWFNRAHYKKETWNGEGYSLRNERTSAWNVTRPVNPEDYISTELEHPDGTKFTILRKPSLRYHKYQVKKEYKNPQVVGENVDVHHRWLPKNLEQGAPDDRFINKEYYRIKRDNPRQFQMLERIKKFLLDAQADSNDTYAKIGLVFPSFQKHGAEAVLGQGVIDRLNPVVGGLKSFFDNLTLRKDDPHNPNYLKDINTAGLDILTSDPKLVIEGKWDMELDELSLDVFNSLARYTMSLERLKELSKLHPLAKGLREILNDTAGYSDALNKVNKQQRQPFFGHLFSSSKLGNKVRAASVNHMIDRDLYGIGRTGLFKDSVLANRLMNAAFKGASISYLALSLPAAVANAVSQALQNTIEASGGKYFNFKDLGVGSRMAFTDMGDITFETYKIGPKGLNVQMIELFNVLQGRMHDKMGTSISRTLKKDAVSMSWLFSPMKWSEALASVQMFRAMMNHQRITREINGEKQEISYNDAWELKDGVISLRDGIDPSWGIGGEKFNTFHANLDKVMRDQIGSFDQLGQPELARYAIFRMYSFLRKHVTNMITNRWAVGRLNAGTLDYKTGYYTQSLKALRKTLIDGLGYLKTMTAEEQRAFKMVGVDLGFIFGSLIAMGVLFGWDSEDEDRYEKLRQRSGPLPLPGVQETDYPFHVGGWLANHALLQTMRMRAWEQMWLPIPGMGLKDYASLTTMAPIAIGPTLNNTVTTMGALLKLIENDPAAYYQRPVGPFIYQQEGSPKILNHLFKFAGASGTTVEPIKGVHGEELKESGSLQSR